MKGTVVIFGANGFLGRYLTRHYLGQGREVVAVGRHEDGIEDAAMHLEWDGRTLGPWALALEGADLVINLAGRSVNCRYNPENREEILASRTASTRVIGQAIGICQNPPRVWMNSSTATFYRHAEDVPQDEWSGEPGSGFSVEVATAWEESFFSVMLPGAVRKVALRTGMVLACEEGTVLDVLLKLARRGLGGRMGDGNQRVSWIHMEDFCEALDFLEDAPLADGVFNLTSPEPVTNRELMKVLRRAENLPFGLPASRWMLELGACLMGTETELVLKSRWVIPARLMAEGFEFRWAHLADAVGNLRARKGIDAFFQKGGRRSLGHRAWVPGARPEPV